MRLITVAGIAAALVVTATPAFAAKTAAKDQNVPAASGASAEAGERKICRRLENTGTRMKNERVCLTKAEWQKIEDMK